MEFLTGLVLVAASAGLLAWGGLTMRRPDAAPWTRRMFVAEALAILILTVLAAGIGSLATFIAAHQRPAAYAWAAVCVVAIPALFAFVWRLAPKPRSDRPGRVRIPANDGGPGLGAQS